MRKWFTILEMILVILVMGIIFLFSQNLFLSTNQNSLYSQSCINFLYWDIRNFLEGGITGKGFFSGNQRVFPDTYTIYFDTTLNAVRLRYVVNTIPTTTKTLYLSWGSSTTSSCLWKSYRTLFTGANIGITINKNIQVWSEKNSFELTGTTNTTGGVMVLLCEGITCKQVHQFIIDKRISQIISKRCLSQTLTGWCKERNN